ncbi:MAG: hypothetical protein M0R80_02315 [Proteobacteria bacterium]|jgi:hypothetical protein|nr:hypothetical protein [Pseudomonadota bacterium]
MSYEILLKYHEETEVKGEYNREETKEKIIKCGKPFEDTPLEDVAGKIIAQLARRNILVTDVEVYEYYKKKVNYIEAEDGIKIKGRKFSFDGTVKFSTEDTDESDVEDKLLGLLNTNPNILDLIENITTKDKTKLQQILGKNGGSKPAPIGPIRFEIFDPVEGGVPPPGTLGGLSKGFKFTKGRRYPILQEKPVGIDPRLGLLYMTTDDAGVQRELSDRFFVVPPRLDGAFIEDRAAYVGGDGPEPTLSFGDQVKTDMPDLSTLRRK